MEFAKILSALLAVVLIATFTGAVLGAVPWISFWVLALLLAGYVTYVLPSMTNRDRKDAP